jgi:hypothetical protein
MTSEDEQVIAKVTQGNIGVLLTLLSLSVGAVFGYSSLTAKVGNLAEVVTELRSDLKSMQGNRYTSMDAVRDLGRIQEVMARLEQRTTEIEKCETYRRCSELADKTR